MVNTNDYYWVTLTQKNMVTSDSNYNHFFWVVVTGQFLQCIGNSYKVSLILSVHNPLVAAQTAKTANAIL